jgi:hypothetical protein
MVIDSRTKVGGVALTSKRACHGTASVITLTGTLTEVNQLAVWKRVREGLCASNAAMLSIVELHLDVGFCSDSVAPLVDIGTALIFLVTREQKPEMDFVVSERTKAGYAILVFTSDQGSKAWDWLNFYSRLETSKSSPAIHELPLFAGLVQ